MFSFLYQIIDRFFHGKEATTNWFLIIIFLGLPGLFSFYSKLVIPGVILIIFLGIGFVGSYFFNKNYGQKNFEQVNFWIRVPFYTVLFMALLLAFNYGYRGEYEMETYKIKAFVVKDDGLGYEVLLEEDVYQDYQRFRIIDNGRYLVIKDDTRYVMPFQKGAFFGKFYEGNVSWR